MFTHAIHGNVWCVQNGNTIMHVAARHGQAEVISFLRSIHCPEKPIDLFLKNNVSAPDLLMLFETVTTHDFNQ